jgi:CheY-like chemotaxis protein
MPEKVILLVEDDPNDLLLTQRALDKSRVANRVEVARDGAEALARLFGHGEWEGRPLDPVLVLLDLKLPKVDGLAVLERLRANERTRRLPVVALTSSAEETDLLRSYDLGVNSYVVKPIGLSDFSDAVRQLGLYWLVLNEPPPHGRGG